MEHRQSRRGGQVYEDSEKPLSSIQLRGWRIFPSLLPQVKGGGHWPRRLLSIQTLQLIPCVSEQRKMFKTQTRSEPCSGEKLPRKSLVQPTLLLNSPLNLSMLPSCSPQILLHTHRGRKLPHPACIFISQNLRQLLTLIVQVRRQEQALSSALDAPNEFYVNYLLYQCCDIVNSILLGIFNALQMQ